MLFVWMPVSAPWGSCSRWKALSVAGPWRQRFARVRTSRRVWVDWVRGSWREPGSDRQKA